MRLGALLDLLFPSFCVRCTTHLADGNVLCDGCAGALSVHRSFFCGRCRARMPVYRKICHRSYPYVLGAAVDYRDETVRALIHALKFRYAKNAALPLARLLISYASSLDLPPVSLVVPIPLGPRRLRARGFNQSLLIATHFANHFRVPLSPIALRRERNTPPQSDLSGLEARRRNVAGCFAANPLHIPRGAHVVLVDDVVTSGATFFEAASALKGAGARRVTALAVAKAS